MVQGRSIGQQIVIYNAKVKLNVDKETFIKIR